MPDNRITKVLKLEILKPADGMTWNELGQRLRDVRYRVFRLANLAVSEAYLNFHRWRTGRDTEMAKAKIGELNKRLREMLISETEERSKNKVDKQEINEQMNHFAKKGAVSSYVSDALSHYVIKGLTQKNKWRDVIRGVTSLPTFRHNMAIPIRCDKLPARRLQRTANGDVELELMVCIKPYPKVVLKTGKLDGGPREVLDRLLDNTDQSKNGYRQRCFQVKQDDRTKRWWLNVAYDFPVTSAPHLSKDRVVGVDLGFACPVYAAISNGHARLGWKHFVGLANRIRILQRQTMKRRRDMLHGGKSSLSEVTARSGHGRKRKLRSIEQLRGRIDDAYKTLNHQLSAAVVKFALDHGAGVIQMEDLSGLQERLTGTFLGERWRYHELQQFIEYKAKEQGIEVRRVDPRYTSRRCSKCGFIDQEFTRAFRDTHRKDGYAVKFKCPKCEYEADADYNAARNLATLDIAQLICKQCKEQKVETEKKSPR